MKKFPYCMNCGEKTLQWDGSKKWCCPNCGFTLFNNVAGAVAVLVVCKDEIMFTRRNQDPGKGKLDLSGGFTDPEESAEETCARELKEELSISIDTSKLRYLGSQPNVYLYKEIPYNTLDLFYEYEVEKKFDVTLEISEISEIIWIKKSEIHLDDIAFESQRGFLENYM